MQTRQNVANVGGPKTIFVLPAKISLRGPACHRAIDTKNPSLTVAIETCCQLKRA